MKFLRWISVSLLLQAIFASSATNLYAQTSESWAKHNRYIELYSGSHQQNYQEEDTQGLTTNGILDSETGSQEHFGAAVRWQATNGWLVHLQAQRQSGTTHYNGHLQSGSGTLTQYRAFTGNVATQLAVQVGYALNSDTLRAIPAHLQITPLVQLGENRWQRNLVQYSEAYRYTTTAVGAQLQWQARPGTVLEVQAIVGQTGAATVNVNSLGIVAQQPGAAMRQWHVGVGQDLGRLLDAEAFRGWRLIARYSQSTVAHDASPLVNGLQAPPNQHQPSEWVIGLQRQFSN